ncbi:tyrosine-type recombinase/integrase [Mycobacterium sp.]|uniref:tyrosine-type recombinase/integrase n=1 Tax=Mycobacterium sp. TaxID=1785 RepID=UPI003BA87185
MASIRSNVRKDGTTAHRVFFRCRGQQTCLTFDNPEMAETFRVAVDQLGADKAMELHRIDREPRATAGMTVADWLKHHIDHLTGVDPRTIEDYRSYVRKDIAPVLGAVALGGLTRDDVKRWVQAMEHGGASPKTVANKHGFLSAALAGAVVSGRIGSNPAAGTRLPRGERQEMVFLTKEDFATILAEITEPWRPLVEILVASGARWSEVTALRPSDIDRAQHTVRISRAWKRGGGGYRIGAPKTRRSVRTINVPATVLDKLDYTGDWLFTNPGRGRRAAGGPVRAPNFRTNVWWPAIERSKLTPRPRIHDLRHTCASWLIQAGTPLTVIQRHLGHESIQTTVDVYGHLDRRSAQEAADALGGFLT